MTKWQKMYINPGNCLSLTLPLLIIIAGPTQSSFFCFRYLLFVLWLLKRDHLKGKTKKDLIFTQRDDFFPVLTKKRCVSYFHFRFDDFLVLWIFPVENIL